jgi:hypothetical protein
MRLPCFFSGTSHESLSHQLTIAHPRHRPFAEQCSRIQVKSELGGDDFGEDFDSTSSLFSHIMTSSDDLIVWAALG